MAWLFKLNDHLSSVIPCIFFSHANPCSTLSTLTRQSTHRVWGLRYTVLGHHHYQTCKHALKSREEKSTQGRSTIDSSNIYGVGPLPSSSSGFPSMETASSLHPSFLCFAWLACINTHSPSSYEAPLLHFHILTGLKVRRTYALQILSRQASASYQRKLFLLGKKCLAKASVKGLSGNEPCTYRQPFW